MTDLSTQIPLQQRGHWLQRHGAKLLLVLALSVPAVVAVLQPQHDNHENRELAALPAAPADWAGVLKLPAQLDGWINDHFGYRGRVLSYYNRFRFAVFNEFPTIQVRAGRHGRIFVSAHGVSAPAFSAITAACAGPGDTRATTAAAINHMFHEFRAAGFTPKLLIAPSAPVIEYRDVPRWLRQRCESLQTPVVDLFNSGQLEAGVRADILYPLAEMRAIRAHAEINPLKWFHWSGAGLADVVKLVLPALKRAPGDGPPLPLLTQYRDSDLNGLFQGLPQMGDVTDPDFAKAGIESCYGGRCFPEFEEYAELLYDISRFRNPAAPGGRRLLIISDSFGSKIAGWFTPHYRDVEQVASNYFGRMTPSQLARMKQFMLRDPEHTDLLILYHDTGALSGALEHQLKPIFPL